MKNKSIYAVIVGIVGYAFFLVAQYLADHLDSSAAELKLTSSIYILCGLGLLMFIVSIVLGVQGYQNLKGSKAIGWLGALFTPFLLILTIVYFIVIGWSAFV